MNHRRLRLALASGLVCLTPGMIALWLQFFVSGATYYNGHREMGHVYKYIWLVVFFEFPISAVTVLLCGLLAVWMARRSGPLRAFRLMVWATAISLLIVGPFVLYLHLPPAGFVILPVAGIGLGSFLALEFILVGGIPWRSPGQIAPASANATAVASVLDRLIVVTAGAVGALSVILIACLSFVAIQHGCGCG